MKIKIVILLMFSVSFTECTNLTYPVAIKPSYPDPVIPGTFVGTWKQDSVLSPCAVNISEESITKLTATIINFSTQKVITLKGYHLSCPCDRPEGYYEFHHYEIFDSVDYFDRYGLLVDTDKTINRIDFNDAGDTMFYLRQPSLFSVDTLDYIVCHRD